MTKPTKKLTAREFVWVHRIRQRMALERIIFSIGTPQQKYRAKRFLEAMEQAYPEILEDIDHLTPELFEDIGHLTPELFDHSEYSKAKGRKTALKLPKDILWEEKIIRRAVREYRDLFHPCENLFNNAMKGLLYLHNLHPELFARAREMAVLHRDQILTAEIYCKCDCTTPENRQSADSFKLTNRGRFENVSKRITCARQTLEEPGNNSQGDWQFFLDRIGEVAHEMLE